MSEIMKGAYDLHVHTSPDIVSRKCNDLELAGRLIAAGMRGGAIKCHHGDTAARAKMLNELYPQLHMAGGVTLNNAVGGLNPDAVECSAKMGAKMLWFPTLDAYFYQRFRHPENTATDRLLTVLDHDGRLVPAARNVLDVAAEYHLLTGTGHLSADEGMVLVTEGQQRGVQMILTHADLPSNRYTMEQMKTVVGLGAMIELCYFTVYYERTPLAQVVECIQQLGAEHIILTTDFGQVGSPYSDEGMEAFIDLLMQQGITEKEIRQMSRDNPMKLIEG